MGGGEQDCIRATTIATVVNPAVGRGGIRGVSTAARTECCAVNETSHD
jgi:hypothetical protein